MTVSSQVRKAGPYSGTGSTGPFTFSFKVFKASDLLVVKVNNSTQVETTLTLTTDYTVSLNADQNSNPGGTITLVSALASGYNMVISSQVPYLQETDLTNQGGFYPEVITDALDKLTIEVQQIKLDTDRSAKLPITSTQSTDDLVADLIRIADSADNIDTVANNIADVNIVADNIDDVNTVADNINDITNFANRYQGALAADPATRTNGDPLQVGDLYFNTVYNEMRVYSASGWKSTVNYAATVERFSGDGSTTAFNLSAAPLGENNTQLYISGVYQQKNTYEVSGTTITFSSAPPAGTDNIEVVVFTSLIAGATVDSANVQFTPAGAGAQTITVQTKLRETVSVKDFGAVGNGVTDDSSVIQACINAAISAGGGTIYFPRGTYKLNTALVGGSNIHLKCDANVFFDFSSITSSGAICLSFAGSFGTEIPLGANAARGDTQITTSTPHGLVVGDWVFLMSQRAALHADAGSWQLGETTANTSMPYFAEPLQVKTVNSDTTVTFATSIIFPSYRTDRTQETYNSTRVSTIRKINFCENVKVTGNPTLIVRGLSDSSYATGIVCYLCKEPEIEATFDLGSLPSAGMYLNRCFYGKAKAKAWRPVDWNRGSYSHAAFNSFKDLGAWWSTWEVEDYYGSQGLDVTYGGGASYSPYSISIQPTISGKAYSPKETGITFHAGSYGGSVLNYSAFNCPVSGIFNRSRFVNITNFYAFNSGASTSARAIILGSWAVDCVVSDFNIDGYYYGISIDKDTELGNVGRHYRNVEISNGIISNAYTGMRIVVASGTGNETAEPCGIHISNVRFSNSKLRHIWIDNYWNFGRITNCAFGPIENASREAIYISANAVGWQINNVSFLNIGSTNDGINAGYTITDTTTFPAADYPYSRHRVEPNSINVAGPIDEVYNTPTVGYYRPTSSFTLPEWSVGELIVCAATAPITITIPTDSINIPIGSIFTVFQETSASLITLSASSGVILLSTGVKSKGIGSIIYLKKLQTNRWVAWGDLADPATLIQATIASDTIDATGLRWVKLETEGSNTTDDLSTITGGYAGQYLTLKQKYDTHDVTVKTGIGNISLVGGDYTIANATRSITLFYDGSTWNEVARTA